jgi:hypothetical protein
MVRQVHVSIWERKVKAFIRVMGVGLLALDIVHVFSHIIHISTNKLPLAVQ